MFEKWLPLLLTVFLGNQEPVVEPAPQNLLPENGLQTVAVGKAVTNETPDFGAYKDVKAKKQAFFDYMLPMVRAENAAIRKNRAFIMGLQSRLESDQNLRGGEHQTLKQLFTRYRLKLPEQVTSAHLDDLLKRVDVVPASLVLAQSANESGWGTSRFAVEANNFFGIWCFTEGCGLKPLRRSTGMNHEVAKYDSVQSGVRAYMHTINTHRAYVSLREIRAQRRDEQLHPKGHQLAAGLLKYSERGEDYVEEIQAMIRVNKLETYTLVTNA